MHGCRCACALASRQSRGRNFAIKVLVLGSGVIGVSRAYLLCIALLRIKWQQSGTDGTASDIAVLQRYGVGFERLEHEAASAMLRRLRRFTASSSAVARCSATKPGIASSSRKTWQRWPPPRAVQFRSGTTIKHLRRTDQRTENVITDVDTIEADAYLVALGTRSPWLLKPAGISLPVYPVKGWVDHRAVYRRHGRARIDREVSGSPLNL